MIETWTRGSADANMPEAILTEQAALVRQHPWWLARARLILAALKRNNVLPPSRVLDAGCGWGVTLESLEQSGYVAAGMDISRQALEMLQADKHDRQLIEADLTQSLSVATDKRHFDAVLALDVLEHLDDDQFALVQLGKLVRPGGLVLISVPALPELFSDFDAIQGHRRRYLPETLSQLFVGTSLQLQQVLWWGAWMVPLLRFQRKPCNAAAGRTPSEIYNEYLRLPPWPAPWLFRAAFAWEHRRCLTGRLRRGTSLIAIARRIANENS
ncbi:MAG: class I SAM-dependent methyltransferase [Pirellulaceae bacterium]